MHAKPSYRGRHRRPSRMHLLLAGPIVALALTLAGCGGADVETQEPAQANEGNATQSTPEPEPSPEDTYEAPEPQTLSGSGKQVVEVADRWADHPALITLSHSGSRNFIVRPVTPDGEEQTSVVNHIGSYDGSAVFNIMEGPDVAAFQVEADGSWEITLDSVTEATEWVEESISGSGDDVVQLPPADGMESVTATHSGERNFIAHAYGDGRKMLFNEIGSFEGETLLPSDAVIIDVTADGDWTLERSS